MEELDRAILPYDDPVNTVTQEPALFLVNYTHGNNAMYRSVLNINSSIM